MPPSVTAAAQQQVSSAAPQYQPDEVQIHDRIYTIDRAFMKKHPGGTIIKSKLGTNCTQAYVEFHYRSKKADKWLKSLPSRPSPFKQDALLEDFDKLRAELVRDGMFDPSPVHVAYRIVEILAMVALGYWLVHQGWYWVGMFILGIASGRCGWIQHEGNHHSLTGNITIDKIIGSFFFSMGEAGSAAWWTSSHNRHHASPQHVGYDSDLNTLPAMAFDRVTARLGNPKWLKFQAWTFELSTWLVVLFWKVYLHPVAIFRKKAWKDGLFLVLHYYVWYKAFIFQGVGGMIFSHLVWGSVAGSYLFTHFALSHTHKEILLHEEQEDWVRSSVLRTVNISNNFIVNWIMGYLNFQIEHHLFPNMPQFRQPEVSPRVEALCKKHGLHYHTMTYFEAFYHTFKNLNDVGHGHGGAGSSLLPKVLEMDQQKKAAKQASRDSKKTA